MKYPSSITSKLIDPITKTVSTMRITYEDGYYTLTIGNNVICRGSTRKEVQDAYKQLRMAS